MSFVRYAAGVMAVASQVLGAVLLVAGVAVWSPPVAMIVAGLLLLAGGTLAERARSAAVDAVAGVPRTVGGRDAPAAAGNPLRAA